MPNMLFASVPFTLTHGLFAALLVSLMYEERSYWGLAFVAGMLPDLDGIPVLYDPALFYRVHHELFHSPIYGVILGVVAAYCLNGVYGLRGKPVFTVVALSFTLHGVTDVLFTNWYVKLLWPLSSIKFSYPVLMEYNQELVWLVTVSMVARLIIHELGSS